MKYKYHAAYQGLIAIAFIACLGIVSCGKKQESAIIGTWNIRTVKADTSNHTEQGLSAEVWAGILADGGTMTFNPNDSMVITYSPEAKERHLFYTVQEGGNSIVTKSPKGRLDTMAVTWTGDTLHLSSARRHSLYTLTRH